MYVDELDGGHARAINARYIQGDVVARDFSAVWSHGCNARSLSQWRAYGLRLRGHRVQRGMGQAIASFRRIKPWGLWLQLGEKRRERSGTIFGYDTGWVEDTCYLCIGLGYPQGHGLHKS
jgi:hypothetical protein